MIRASAGRGRRPILIVGLSTRAIAESAVRGRYNVITLDYFGDRDQKELVQNHSLMRDFDLGFSAEALLTASRSLNFGAVVYISDLENHPNILEELAAGRTLLGNDPAILRLVRDWRTLRRVCWREGIPIPVILLPGEEGQANRNERWLSKPVLSGGGHGITFWAGEPLGDGVLLQEYIEGLPCSAAFVADGRRCVLLGLAEQLIGRWELGAQGFIWCGNILPVYPSFPPEFAMGEDGMAVTAMVQEILQKLTRALGLRGINGVDFVLGRDEDGDPLPYLVEINPRYTDSMELVEWAYDLNVFGLHVHSFRDELPFFSFPSPKIRTGGGGIHRSGFYSKGIVYAQQDVVMPDTAEWRDQGRRDIPFPGQRITAGHPICTVLAEGMTRDECWLRLRAAGEAVWQEVRK